MRLDCHLFTLLGLALPIASLGACNDPSSDDGAGTETGTAGDGDGDGDGDSGDGDGDSGDGDGDGDGDECMPGEITCVDGTANICDAGGVLTEEPCPDECADGIGCVLCIPGSSECQGDMASLCADDGMSWEESYCDPLQGLTCDAGNCMGACAEITGGFLGCDFYPTMTAAATDSQSPIEFGVIVSNHNDSGTNICITQGGSDTCMMNGFIGPNTVQTFVPPNIDALLNSTLSAMLEPSVFVEDGAYRVRSDLPVSVYQFNPLGLTIASADASLLFPARSWGTEYIVVSRNHWQYFGVEVPGFYAVVGREQDTMVDLYPSSTGGVVAPGGGVAADGTGHLTLHRGDVLEVFTWRLDGGDPNLPVPSDLTGTRIVANKPIQVIGGSKCTDVPFNVFACDRLEDAILPTDLASTNYIVSAPVRPATSGVESAQRMIRVVATQDDTGVSYNPAVMGAPTSIMYAGDYIEFASTASFAIDANKPVLVAEYMTGVDFGGGGDPSMALAIPTTGFLTEYLIFAPTIYDENWINIVFDVGTVIELDGGTIIDANGAEQLGFSSWRVKRVPLSNAGDGTHSLVAQGNGMPFGLSVYGYASSISYWYPGGINLPAR